MKDDEPYFIPLTLKGIADFINKAIRENEDLNGNELVVGSSFVYSNDYNFPPGTILLDLKKSIPGEDDLYGTLVMMPHGVKIVQ